MLGDGGAVEAASCRCRPGLRWCRCRRPDPRRTCRRRRPAAPGRCRRCRRSSRSRRRRAASRCPAAGDGCRFRLRRRASSGCVSVKAPLLSSMRTRSSPARRRRRSSRLRSRAEAEVGRAVVTDVDLEGAGIAGLQAKRDLVARARALDGQRAVLELRRARTRRRCCDTRLGCGRGRRPAARPRCRPRRRSPPPWPLPRPPAACRR